MDEDIELKYNPVFEKAKFVMHQISAEYLEVLKKRVADAQTKMMNDLEKELFPPYEPGPCDIRELLKVSLWTRIKRKYWAIREKIGFWIAGHNPSDYDDDYY